MSWIRIEEPDVQADATARGSSSAISGMSLLGRVLGVHGLQMEALLRHELALSREPLSPAQLQLVALVVSATNGCAYCVAHFGPRLASALDDHAMARVIARDYRAANLTARDRVLLDYAVALTCEPSERKLEDVDRMREYGFDDQAILQVTHWAAFIGLVNRLASGLGVSLEPGIEPWEFGTQR